jgi:hypothetical protein
VIYENISYKSIIVPQFSGVGEYLDFSLKVSGASSPIIKSGTDISVLSGTRYRKTFSYSPTALSKEPAILSFLVVVIKTPTSVLIAFSTLFTSLARTGFNKFQAIASP